MTDCKSRIALMVKASDVGERALKKGIDILKNNNCKKLDLLFVIDKGFFAGNSSGYVKPDYLVEKGLEEIGRAVLDDIEGLIKKTDGSIETNRVILHGKMVEAIQNFLRNNNIDILIIPKNKRGPIEKFITGGDLSELIKEIEAYTKVIVVE